MITAAWILICILAIILIALAEAGALGWATGVALAIGGLLIYTGFIAGPAIWLFIKANPLIVVSLLVVYILAGTVWSVIKWWFFVRKNRREQEESKKKHPNSVTIRIPQVGDYKSKITTWMTFWPLSLLWTMIDDPIRAIFLHIYHGISNKLQAIANNAFKDVDTSQ
jgi:hypothetical protein